MLCLICRNIKICTAEDIVCMAFMVMYCRLAENKQATAEQRGAQT